MRCTFDATKDQTNQAKHGVSLALAKNFEWDSAVVWSDERRDYGELRQCALGYIADRLVNVVFVDRGDNRRIISLRKANKREERIYAET